MSINELPDEILVRILSFLPRTDRLESALTCRRWAQTVARTPPLLRGIRLVIKGYRKGEPAAVFANSHRHYENLLFALEYDEYNDEFWEKVGPTLRKLKLIGKYCRREVFFFILESCSNLESLEIDILDDDGIDETFYSFQLSELPPAIDLKRIQESMYNLRHLHLVSPTNADTLERLFILMPNVSSIAFGMFGRLKSWKSDLLSRLPNILGASRRIKLLHLDMDVCNDECVQLLRISSASLRTLRFDEGFLCRTEVLDALRDCSMLRDLDIRMLEADESRLLLNILENFPELEYLSIRSDRSDGETFRQEDLMAVFNLRKLRKLHLDFGSGSDACVPDEIVQNLSRMISLESLRVGSRLGTVDNTRFRILAGMPSLRKLRIDRIRWDAECLRIVLSDLGKLKTLKIGASVSFRDRGFSLRDQHSELERNMSTPPDSVSSDRQGEKRFSSLEVLRIEGIPFCDACLARITAHHNRLKIVTLFRCHDITDAGLVALFQDEPLLEELAVSSGSDLDGSFLEGLGMLCRRLRSLQVYRSARISRQAQEEFKLRRPRVKCYFSEDGEPPVLFY